MTALRYRIRSARLWLRRQPKFALQRARRGYSTGDTWSFDHYLATVIAGGVRELQARAFSHPCDIASDEWAAILGEIADGFQAYAEHDGLPLSTDAGIKFERAFDLLRAWWPDLWD